jgi:hypothetical protein
MKLILSISLFISLLMFVSSASAQKSSPVKPTPTPTPTDASSSPLRSSAAYAEVLLKRTELKSELESLVIEFTEEYPRVKEIRFVLGLLDRDTARLGKVKSTEASKLTLALGKLMLRRVELETELWKLLGTYKDEHPDVKQAKRRVEIFDQAINEILN